MSSSIELSHTLWEDNIGEKILVVREDMEIEMIQIGFTKFCSWTEPVKDKKDSDIVCESSLSVEQTKQLIKILQVQVQEIENRK
jgi:hypothetical protein